MFFKRLKKRTSKIQDPPTEKQKEVLAKFKTPKTPRDAAKELGHEESAPIFGAIKGLIRRGLLKKQGTGRETTYQSTEEE